MKNTQTKNATTLFLIRHAEKLDDTKNTDLSPEGFERAQYWKKYFESTEIDAFYSSGFQRARRTCQPMAFSRDKDVNIYKNHLMDLRKLMSENKGKTVMVVGHSNRITTFINKLLGKEKYPEIKEPEFGNLYIIKELDGEITSQLIIPKKEENAAV
jgi:2,3-bisphosphoglycerate-dependent phosphoglycerate mutase